MRVERELSVKAKAILALWLVFIFLSLTGQSSTFFVGGESNYTLIQKAIDAASPGDIILVNPGTYKECVDVNKRLILKGIGMPVISMPEQDLYAVYSCSLTLSANGSVLEGFAVTNASGMAGDPGSGEGILVLSDGNIIKGNYLYGNWANGIKLFNASYNIIEENNNNNTIRITMDSHDNLIKNNEIHDSYGLVIINSDHNVVVDNNITDNVLDMSLEGANSNIITGNTIGNRIDSLYSSAVELWRANNNTFEGNFFIGDKKAVYAQESCDNRFFGNKRNGMDLGNESV